MAGPCRGAADVTTIATTLLPAALAVLAFGGVLGCYFVQDDFYWLFRAAHVPARALLLESVSGHLLLTRNAILLASWTAFGPDARAFFATVLVAHGAAAVLLAAVLRRWALDPWLAAGVAGAWAVAPLHAGTLGWYSAATHGWSTCAVLVALVALPPIGRARLFLAVPALLAAASTFGTGLAAAAVAPGVAWLARPGDRRALVATALAGGLAMVTYAVTVGGVDRVLLIDPRLQHAMSVYGGLTWPGVALELFGGLVWTGLVDLGAGRAGGAALATLIVAGLARPTSRRLTAVGVLLAASAYGAVAIGRAGLVGDVGLPLWGIARVRHYHYAAQAGIALAAGSAASGLVGRQASGVGAVLVLAAALRVVLAPPAIDAQDAARRAVADVERVARAATGPLPNRPFAPTGLLRVFIPPDRMPGVAGVFATFHPDGTIDGRPVHFVAQSSAEYAAVRLGGPIARILLPPRDVAQAR